MDFTSDEQSVSGENHLLVPVHHQPADAILRMARGMQCCDGDLLSDLKGFFMLWRSGDAFAVLPTNHGQLQIFEFG